MASFDPVIVLFNELSADAAKDELDVLYQVDAVSDALKHLGFSVSSLVFSSNLAASAKVLLKAKPRFVFNLVLREEQQKFVGDYTVRCFSCFR